MTNLQNLFNNQAGKEGQKLVKHATSEELSLFETRKQKKTSISNDDVATRFHQRLQGKLITREEIDSLTDPNQIKLRDKICKENGYTFVGIFKDGMARVLHDGVWGLVKTDGKLLLLGYPHIGPFVDGLALVKKDRKYGFFNTKGELVIPHKYENARDFSDGLAAVEKPGGWWSFINTNGEESFPLCHKVESFSEGLASVQIDVSVGIGSPRSRLWIVIDTKGVQAIPSFYGYKVGRFYKGLAYTHDAERNLINLKGEDVVSISHHPTDDFSEGFAPVKDVGMLGKYGFVNQEGEMSIPFKFEGTKQFSEGLAAVLIDRKWGFINTEGKEVIPCEYKEVESFSEGVAKVEKDGEVFYIDHDTRRVFS